MTDPDRSRTNDVLESIRDAVEDLAEKAGPMVRDLSAKAADAVAVAADKAAPLVQRAGEVTADASGRLAKRSRTYAAEVRESKAPPDGSPQGAAPQDADGATDADSAMDAVPDPGRDDPSA